VHLFSSLTCDGFCPPAQCELEENFFREAFCYVFGGGIVGCSAVPSFSRSNFPFQRDFSGVVEVLAGLLAFSLVFYE